jgi:hypothetical protein
MNKKVVDGKVGVVISPGYGAGWSTWESDNETKESLLFDSVIVDYISQEDWDSLDKYVDESYPNVYTGGMNTLKVVWLDIGTQFRVHEYDGYESIVLLDQEERYIA